MKSKLLMFAKFMMMLVIVFGVAVPAFAAGEWEGDVPSNLEDPGTDGPVANIGKWIAKQLKYLYVLMVAVVATVFVVKHEYSKLIAFLVISIVVAIPIFAPSALPSIAEAIADALQGK